MPDALPAEDIFLTNQTEMRDEKNITLVTVYITLKVLYECYLSFSNLPCVMKVG